MVWSRFTWSVFTCSTEGPSFLDFYRDVSPPRRCQGVVKVVGIWVQAELHVHQVVVTILCRLCPPFSLRRTGPSGAGKPPSFCGASHYFYRISCMNPLFSPLGSWGRKVTRNGGPQFGACLVLSDDCTAVAAIRLRMWMRILHDAPRKFASEFSPPSLKQKVAK